MSPRGPILGSPALPMTSAFLEVESGGNPLENEECRAGWQPWIIEIAGEPNFGVA